MRIGPFDISFLRTKAAVPVMSSANFGWISDWTSIIRESFSGAWQRNIECTVEDVLRYSTVWSCVDLISGDIAKIGVQLVEKDADGIETVTENTAHSPVLRKPNHYQTFIQFYRQWILSKLLRGNTYILKARDASGIVRRLYPLDATRVRPMIAEDGSVFYALSADNLSGLTDDDNLMVPASEVIHDRGPELYHPLMGVSPLYAFAASALQGLKIQHYSNKFFENHARPGGILSAPGTIHPDTAKRLEQHWASNYGGDNIGRIAVVGDGLKFEPIPAISAQDAQLIDQLKMTSEMICSVFHVPPYKVGVGPPPTYTNIEALNVAYYTDCLQIHIESIEVLLNEGLELPRPLGTRFDIDALARMDTAAKVEAANKSINSGGMSPNEARKKYHGLPPVPGGESPYLQEQNWPLRHLANRPLPDRPVTTPADVTPDPVADEDVTELALSLFTAKSISDLVH